MIDIVYVALIVGLVLVALVAYAIFRALIKVVFTVLTVLSILVLLFGAFAYFDAVKLKNNMQNSSNVYLLRDGGAIVAGFEGSGMTREAIRFFSEDEISGIDDAIRAGDREEVLGDSFKLFVISSEAFEGIESIELNNAEYSLNETLALIKDAEPVRVFVSRVYRNLGIEFSSLPEEEQKNIMNEVRDALETREDQEFRDFVFAVLFSNALQKKGEFFLVNEFRKGNIEIYPETVIFAFLKRVPSGIFNKAMTVAKDKAGKAASAAKSLAS